MRFPHWTLTKHVSVDVREEYGANRVSVVGEASCYPEMFAVGNFRGREYGLKPGFAGNTDCRIEVGTAEDLKRKDTHALKGRRILYRQAKGNARGIHQTTVKDVSPNGKYILLHLDDWWAVDDLEILDVLEDAP